MFADPDPKALVKRAERVLRFGEQIMERAIGEQDYRLGLQSLDRVQRSLDQLLRVHGLLNDGGVQITVDARRQSAALFDGASTAALRRIIAEAEAQTALPAATEAVEADLIDAAGDVPAKPPTAT